jgi:hypothetical protein
LQNGPALTPTFGRNAGFCFMELKRADISLIMVANNPSFSIFGFRLAEDQSILRSGTDDIAVDIPNHVVLKFKLEEEDKKGEIKRMQVVEIVWIEKDESAGVVALC